MGLHDLANSYHPLISRLLKESNGSSYFALFLEPNIDLITRDAKPEVIAQVQQFYILGILERCHLASITSLARTDRWLQSLMTQIIQENALGFSAALRGLLEATADAHDVMSVMPSTLRDYFSYIYLVFTNHNIFLETSITFNELEERLIHYAYAQKWPKGSKPLPHHTNKTNADYISSFEKFGVSGAIELYNELCQLTHPASASVSCFLRETPNSIEIDFSQDQKIITDILLRYEQTIEKLMQLSVNPALISLCFLRRLLNEWPAPTDKELSGIGKIQDWLIKIDNFIENFKVGVVDYPSFK